MNKIYKIIITLMIGLGFVGCLSTSTSAKLLIDTPSSLLNFVETKDATGDVKAVYEEIQKAWGMVPIVMKQYSLNPELLRNQWEFYKTLGKNKNFDPKMGTMMRMLVSDNNDCEYCVGFNTGYLMNFFKVPMSEIKALKKDPRSAKLDAKQKAMLLFMLKSANNPKTTSASDIDGLKKLGWSEKDIFDGVKMSVNMVSVSLIIEALKIQKDY